MSIPQRKLYFTGVLTFKAETNLAPQYIETTDECYAGSPRRSRGLGF